MDGFLGNRGRRFVLREQKLRQFEGFRRMQISEVECARQFTCLEEQAQNAQAGARRPILRLDGLVLTGNGSLYALWLQRASCGRYKP